MSNPLEEPKSNESEKDWLDNLYKFYRARGFLRLRPKSVQHDFKTGILCRFTLMLGIILLIIYALEKSLSPIDLASNAVEALLALSIIFIGVGILLYFISCQFAKLAKIAEEIENEGPIENNN